MVIIIAISLSIQQMCSSDYFPTSQLFNTILVPPSLMHMHFDSTPVDYAEIRGFFVVERFDNTIVSAWKIRVYDAV